MPTFFDENLAPSVTQETDAALVALGQRGFIFTDDTTAVNGNFAAIQIIADTVFASLTALNSTVGNLAGGPVTLPAGIIIYGPFTSYDLTSGKVIAYKAG
jgi:hypothetical protein